MLPLVAQQLQVARWLASVDEGGPFEASMRRAVSTAYYALFQALCEACAMALVGTDKSSEAYQLIFRQLDHGPVAQTLKQSSASAEPDLAHLGEAFNRLKKAREWADYSPDPRPGFVPSEKALTYTRNEALRTIEEAEEAIHILNSISDDARLTLAARLVTRSRR